MCLCLFIIYIYVCVCVCVCVCVFVIYVLVCLLYIHIYQTHPYNKHTHIYQTHTYITNTLIYTKHTPEDARPKSYSLWYAPVVHLQSNSMVPAHSRAMTMSWHGCEREPWNWRCTTGAYRREESLAFWPSVLSNIF